MPGPNRGQRAFAGVMFALVAMFVVPATVVVDSPRDAAHISVDLAKVSNPTDMRGADREDALGLQLRVIVRFGSPRIGSRRRTCQQQSESVLAAEPNEGFTLRPIMRARYGGVAQ